MDSTLHNTIWKRFFSSKLKFMTISKKCLKSAMVQEQKNQLLLLAITSLILVPSLVLAQMCVNGDLRLANGTSPLNGRIEVCNENVWGTVCDDDISTNSPSIVCRQLGYSDQGATLLPSPSDGGPFGEGTGPIILDQVWCAGTERALIDCRHDGVRVHDCAHGEDIGVACNTTGCIDGSARLVGSGSRLMGRVEVCVNQMWGTVSASDWGEEEAMVVCRQLGFLGYGSFPLPPSEHDGRGAGPILDIQCYGCENNLTTCTIRHTGHNYDHSTDAGVECHALGSLISPFCTNTSLLEDFCQYFEITTTTLPLIKEGTTSMKPTTTDNTTSPTKMDSHYLYSTIGLGAIVVIESIVLLIVVSVWVCTCVKNKRSNNRKEPPMSTRPPSTSGDGSMKMVACASYGSTKNNEQEDELYDDIM